MRIYLRVPPWKDPLTAKELKFCQKIIFLNFCEPLIDKGLGAAGLLINYFLNDQGNPPPLVEGVG